MATWYVIQFLFISLLGVILITQVLMAIWKGWPLFWYFRTKTMKDHLKKAEKELQEEYEELEEDTRKASNYREKASKRKENLEEFRKSLKTKKGPRR